MSHVSSDVGRETPSAAFRSTANETDWSCAVRVGLLGGLVGGVTIWIYEAVIWVGALHLMPLAGIPRNATGLVFGKAVQDSLGPVAYVLGTAIHLVFALAWGVLFAIIWPFFQRRVDAATAEERPDDRKQYAPGERENEVDGGAEDISHRPEGVLHRLAEHEARRVAWDAGQRHQMQRSHPDDGLVDPDRHPAHEAPEEADANGARPVRLIRGAPEGGRRGFSSDVAGYMAHGFDLPVLVLALAPNRSVGQRDDRDRKCRDRECPRSGRGGAMIVTARPQGKRY